MCGSRYVELARSAFRGFPSLHLHGVVTAPSTLDSFAALLRCDLPDDTKAKLLQEFVRAELEAADARTNAALARIDALQAQAETNKLVLEMTRVELMPWPPPCQHWLEPLL